jgi:hypothetical protein
MKYRLLSILLFFTLYAYGQKDTTKHKEEPSLTDLHYSFSAGLSYQKQVVGEVGVIYGKAFGRHAPMYVGYKAATEFNFKQDNFFIAPKLSLELDMMFVGFRLNVMDYTNFVYHDIKFTPEYGICYGNLFTLYYGRNYAISPSRLDFVTKNKITFTITFDHLNFKDLSIF